MQFFKYKVELLEEDFPYKDDISMVTTKTKDMTVVHVDPNWYGDLQKEERESILKHEAKHLCITNKVTESHYVDFYAADLAYRIDLLMNERKNG